MARSSRILDSIDDILNASDSDEDNHVDTAGVDLELLLEDDDDDNTGFSGHTAAHIPANPPTHTPHSAASNVKVSAASAIPKSNSKSADYVKGTNADLEKLLASEDDVVSTPAVNKSKQNAGLAPQNISDDVTFRSSTADSVPSLQHMTLAQTITEVEREDESSVGEHGELASLSLADKREHRFLMAGIRDVISALQSKKRRDEVSSSNNVKCVEMDIVSTQLRKNASFRNHGPGVATVLSIHSKFIAVGTSRGLILLFDHEQEIRQVIGSAVGATARCTAGVSAIDISVNGSVLICGYDTGEVALWDVVKGNLLKRVTDVHSYPICRMSLMLSVGDGYAGPGAGAGIASTSDIFVVSVDVRGSVHRIKISKMLWTSYVSEAECLLDGTAGAVTDMDMLHPFRAASGAETISWGSQVGIGAGNQFIAINSLTRTLLVQINPSIKIRFRWPAPPGSHDPVSGGVLPDILGSLSWSWVDSADCVFLPPSTTAASDGGEGTKTNAYAPPPSVDAHYPILARCWGSQVQLLMVYPFFQGAREEGYQCCLLAEKCFEGCKFLDVKWLIQGVSMALITFTEVGKDGYSLHSHLRMIFFCQPQVYIVRRNLEVIEVCPMLPALCNSVRAMFDSRMSLDQALRAVTWVW
jgi:hypothetical protein